MNGDQIPVFVVDQPLFTVAKQIQWNWPDTIYGEDKYLVMFGGLHIESAALKAIGSWLEGSGWTNIIFEAQVFETTGVADSLVSAPHITRARHAHEVTSATLYLLLSKAYNLYKDGLQKC